MLNYTQWFLDMIFPIRCLGCRRYTFDSRQGYLCEACSSAIPVKRDIECIGCKRAAPDGRTCFLCRPHWAVDRLFIAASYEYPLVARAIHAFKYRFIAALHVPLHRLMETYLDEVRTKKNVAVIQGDVVVAPVPLTPYRTRWRGFNQAELLAHDFALRRNLECRSDVIVRIRQGHSQAAAVNRNERRENIRGLFRCIQPDAVAGRHIILVDDVCTTGSTLDECARVLKSAGASSVTALVIARG